MTFDRFIYFYFPAEKNIAVIELYFENKRLITFSGVKDERGILVRGK